MPTLVRCRIAVTSKEALCQWWCRGAIPPTRAFPVMSQPVNRLGLCGVNPGVCDPSSKGRRSAGAGSAECERRRRSVLAVIRYPECIHRAESDIVKHSFHHRAGQSARSVEHWNGCTVRSSDRTESSVTGTASIGLNRAIRGGMRPPNGASTNRN
jgi:hypothetical protein